jgi:polyisoprenoid-binding protein YceI
MRFTLTLLSVPLALLAFLSSSTSAQTLKLLADKSKIEFVGAKPDGKHTGGFAKFQGEVRHGADANDISLKLEIETASIFSDNEKLTTHLKTPDFFNVRAYPKASFESTKVEKQDDKSGVIHGKLTILGQTKEISIPVQVEHADTVAILKAAFAIDRTDFGMDYGAGKIDNKVQITATLHFPGAKSESDGN